MRRLTHILVAFSMVLAGLSVSAAAAPYADEARAEHQQIVDFWTVDRVRQAVPRDFTLDAASDRFTPTAKGGERGKPVGGGGGDTDVAGASWEAEGKALKTPGKVLFELGGTYYFCSASVVKDDTENGQSIVLTVAHCVYENAGTRDRASKWMFIPDWGGVTEPPNLSDAGTSGFCDATLYGRWATEGRTLTEAIRVLNGASQTPSARALSPTHREPPPTEQRVGPGGHTGTTRSPAWPVHILNTGSSGKPLSEPGTNNTQLTAPSRDRPRALPITSKRPT